MITTADKLIADCARGQWPALEGELSWQQHECELDRAKATSPMVKRSITARIQAIKAARSAIDAQRPMPSLSAAIIALNAVYRIKHIPAHVRTSALVDYEQELVAAGIAMVEGEA